MKQLRKQLTKQFYLKCYQPEKRLVLSNKNINDRLSFCKQYKNQTVDNWHNVILSDESTFKQFQIIQHHVRHTEDKQYDPIYSSPAVKHSPSIMVWGAIGSTGHCSLNFLPKDEKINAKKYLEIIQEKVPQFMVIKNATYLQHDRATPHKAQIVTQWFQQQSFQLLTGWSGNSPDLNIIKIVGIT